MSEMKPRQQFRQWLRMWSWRIQESAAAKLPRFAERFVCPFCRAALADVRGHEREWRREASGNG